MSKFRRNVSFTFEAGGEFFETHGWSIDKDGVRGLEVSETRFNGQEDTHCRGGILEYKENGWEWVEGKQQFDDYIGCTKEIVDFLNENDKDIPMYEKG